MRHRATALVLAISAAYCATANQEGARVRVTRNSDVVRGCAFVGNANASSLWGGSTAGIAEDELVAKLQNSAAAMGGNVLYLTSTHSQSTIATGRAEVYLCSTRTTAAPAPAVAPPALAPRSPVPATTTAVTKIKAGFRDLAWGDAMPSGMVPATGLGAEAEDSRNVFERPTDKLEIAGEKVNRIYYYFLEGRLRVVVVLLSEKVYPSLAAFLNKEWGEPSRSGPGPSKALVWSSTDGATDAELALIGGLPGSEYGLRLLDHQFAAAKRADNGL